MAGGYFIDPATGMPSVRSSGGQVLPLPLSQDDLSASGLQMPDVPRPDLGPDNRLALNTADIAAASRPKLIRDQPAPTAADGIPRIQLGDPNAPPVWQSEGATPGPQMRLPTQEEARTDALRAVQQQPTADPAELAQHRPVAGQAGANSQVTPGGGMNPVTQQVFTDTLNARGGGGPRGMGITGETRKLKTFERAADPELVNQANEAQLASDKYNEEFAKSLTSRHEQAYQAQQEEFAARSGQLRALQERYDNQQSMLQDYAAKRDAVAAEAAQMKTPQMEDYWASKGAFSRIATSIGIVIGAGVRGNQNPGLEISNQAIERWINEQKDAYNRKRGEVSDMDNQYAKMVQTFGNQNLAEQHLRMQAWDVRDNLLRSYAEKVGTPTALEAYNSAMLQSEAEKAKMRAQASRGAEMEVEQKLAMRSGGGTAQASLAKALAAAAEAEKNRRIIAGEDKEKPTPQRAIERERTETLTGALATIDAADSVIDKVGRLGYADSDADDPRAGAYDYLTKNIPGTESRRLGQDLDQDTFQLARGAQQFLGKSDNDANLAERQAAGLGASGRERVGGARRLRDKAVPTLQDQLASMTPEQQAAFLEALPPDRRQKIQSIVNITSAPARSEQLVR